MVTNQRAHFGTLPPAVAKMCMLFRYHLAPIAGLAYFALVQTQLSSIYSKVEMSCLGLCFGL